MIELSKAIKLSRKKWNVLRKRLLADYPLSVMLVRSKMLQVLGFTDRAHVTYDPQTGTTTDIHLDFYNEPKRTFFLLKYGEYIEDKD